MRIEMPVNHHAHPHRETSVKLTVIIQYKTSRIGESEKDQTFAKFAKDFAHFANFTVPLCDVL